MLGDLMAFIGLAKELKGALRRIPDGIGFSIVTYEPSEKGRVDHLRLVNLTPLTIHGFKFSIQVGDRGQEIAVNEIYRLANADVFGSLTTYRIEIPNTGVYLRPGAQFFVPLRDIKGVESWKDDIRIAFTYVDPQGQRLPGNLQHVVRTHAQEGLLDAPPRAT